MRPAVPTRERAGSQVSRPLKFVVESFTKFAYVHRSTRATVGTPLWKSLDRGGKLTPCHLCIFPGLHSHVQGVYRHRRLTLHRYTEMCHWTHLCQVLRGLGRCFLEAGVTKAGSPLFLVL